jgi:molybdenum cofactor cytidylyltransferase
MLDDRVRTPGPGVVILAAGRSERMGRPKVLLPWSGTTILGHLVQQWTNVPAGQIAIVFPPRAPAMVDEMNRLDVPAENRILNPEPERGMFSSIRCAANWAGWQTGLTHWVIALGDQPHLRPATLRALVDFGIAQPDKICQPLWQGKRRHPVLLPAIAFLALATTSAADLKQFLESRGNELSGFECDDPGLDFDLDTPADYERARRSFSRP